ncbi:MAG: transketolase [Acidimicrobiaceae bacterium]|nr:transketolase [Acidimicrobiaceae bacterium]
MPIATPPDLDSLESIARKLRGSVVDLSFEAETPHLASSLSCIDILTAAYWGGLNLDPELADSLDRDRLILSKGHAAAALYSALAYRGYFPVSLLDTFAKAGSCLPEQPSPHCAPGVEAATGSLGHGLSMIIGMALACRLQGYHSRFVAILSDGECNEGSVWEAAMFAPIHRLENVMVVVDYNKWQATGRSNEVMALEPLRDKWESFGWSAFEVDGHDLDALTNHFQNLPNGSGRPVALIAHTVKGKGISFMEDDNNWHYRIPTSQERDLAHSELGLT